MTAIIKGVQESGIWGALAQELGVSPSSYFPTSSPYVNKHFCFNVAYNSAFLKPVGTHFPGIRNLGLLITRK